MREALIQDKCVEALKGEARFEWFCKLDGGVHRGSTEFETLVKEFHFKVEEFQLEVESSDSGTIGREITLALCYQVRDMEKIGSVAPKGYDYEDLVGYVSIVAEEVQNLEDLRGGN
jgi:hypothetical protein